MTSRPATPARRPASRRASRARRALPVYLSMAGLFVGLFGFLAIRVAQGQDPALQPHPTQVAAVRPVIIRRVVVTRHVTVYRPAVKPRRPSASAAAAPAVSSGAAPTQSAPAPVQQVAQTAAPAAAPAPAPTPAPAAAPAPKPAPAPAPAPVATKTS